MTEIKNYLNKIGIKYNQESELDGYLLERNTLVYKDISKYNDIEYPLHFKINDSNI